MKYQSKLLTSRQKEILSLLRKGLTNSEICRALNISANTVKVHLANIYKALEVTNRTEAVSTDITKSARRQTTDDDIHITITGCDGLTDTPLAKGLSLTIVEALHHYHLFRINGSIAPQSPPTYQIQVTGTPEKDENLFVTLYRGDTSEILWSVSQKIGDGDDIQFLASQITIQLFTHMVSSAARTYETDKEKFPRWWFASCYANIQTESGNRDAFDEIVSTLEALLREENHHTYVACSLVSAYYVAINESWVDAERYSAKIGEIACSEMRRNPYSIYSQFMMALYNIVIGNKSEAIAYFLQILDANPNDFRVRRMLAQIYMLVGKEDKALALLNENERFFPESSGQPFQSTPRAFIYFLQGRFAESEEAARQVLLFHPETPLTRLILIACNNKKGDFEQSDKHIRKFFEYHPHFKKSDLEHLLSGIAPSKKDIILDSVKNVFP